MDKCFECVCLCVYVCMAVRACAYSYVSACAYAWERPCTLGVPAYVSVRVGVRVLVCVVCYLINDFESHRSSYLKAIFSLYININEVKATNLFNLWIFKMLFILVLLRSKRSCIWKDGTDLACLSIRRILQGYQEVLR